MRLEGCSANWIGGHACRSGKDEPKGDAANGASLANGSTEGQTEAQELSDKLRERALEALKGSGSVPAEVASEEVAGDEREVEGNGEFSLLVLPLERTCRMCHLAGKLPPPPLFPSVGYAVIEYLLPLWGNEDVLWM